MPSKELLITQKTIIDTFISNTNVVFDNYLFNNKSSPVNQQLFDYFSPKDGEVKDYLIKKARQHAPELLI
jgi:hypothetical protein